MKICSLVIALLVAFPSTVLAQRPSKQDVRYKRTVSLTSVPVVPAARNASEAMKSHKLERRRRPTVKAVDVLATMEKTRPIRNTQICLMLELIWLTDTPMAKKLGFHDPDQSRECKKS